MKLSYFLFLFISPILLVSCGSGKYQSMTEAQRAAEKFMDNGRWVNIYDIERVNREAKIECETSKGLLNKAKIALNNSQNTDYKANAKLRLKTAKAKKAFDCSKKNWGLKFAKNYNMFNEEFTRNCKLEFLTAQYVCEEKKVSDDFMTEKKWSNSKTQFTYFKYRKTQ